ncbi:hypothetical protein AAG906_019779 [Vitis piasezkii]
MLPGVEPDKFCLNTTLKGCAHLGALEQGKWIHEYRSSRGMPKRNVFSWSAMIGGFALHGHVRKAMQCLERMQVEDGLRPDGVVLLEVTMACAHAGLQEEGQSVRGSTQAHKKNPMKPLAPVWGALLSGCQTHNNIDVAELAARELLMTGNGDGTEDGAYVQLSNIYLAA